MERSTTGYQAAADKAGRTTGRSRSISGSWSRQGSMPAHTHGPSLGHVAGKGGGWAHLECSLAFWSDSIARAYMMFIHCACQTGRCSQGSEGIFSGQGLATFTTRQETSRPNGRLSARVDVPRGAVEAGGGRGSQQKRVECPETQRLAGRQWATRAGNEAQGVKGALRAKGWVDVEV